MKPICLPLHRALTACVAAAFCLRVFCGDAACAGVNSWTTSGPPGGTVQRLVASPANDAILYLTSDHAVYKSSDGGASWRVLRQFNNFVQDIAVSPTDPNTVLLAVQDEGLFRSTDGGATFALLVNPRFLTIFSVGMTATVFYYFDSSGFYRSTDNGQTWSARPLPSNPIKLMVVDDANPDVIHGINPGQGFEVLRSIDGGMSWTARALPLSQSGHVRDLVVKSPSELAVATDEGLYVSTDGGVTWSRTLFCDCRAIAKDPRSPNTLLTSNGQYFSTGQLYRSGDSGMTWSFLASTPNSAAEAIVVRQQPSPQIVTANSIAVQRSADNGASWVEADPGPIGYAALEFATTVATGARLYAYSHGDGSFANGLFALDSSGWQRLNLAAAEKLQSFGSRFGQGVLKVRPGNPNELFLATSAFGVAHSLDGGSSWNASGNLPNANSFTFKSFEFDPSNSNIIYAGGTNYGSAGFSGALYRSADGGGSWSPYVLALPNSLTPIRLIIDPANTQRRFVLAISPNAAYGVSALLRSLDGGQTWTQVLPEQEINDVSIHPADSNYVFVAAKTGLLVSSNGGATFNVNNALTLITDRGTRALAIDPATPDTMYVLTYGPDFTFNDPALLLRSSWVFRSVDRGLSWEVLRDDIATPNWAASRIALDPLDPAIVYVATGYRGVAAFELGLDLAATIIGHSGTRAIGAASNFQIRVQNYGPFGATGVHVATVFPAGMSGVTGSGGGSTCTFANNTLDCQIPVVRSGTTTTILVNYVAPQAMVIQATATVSALQRDIAPENNSHTAIATAVEVVDLQPTIVPAATAVNVGELLNFVVQATNNGPSSSSAAVLNFTVPNGLELTAVPSDCSMSGGSATCNVGVLAVGATRSFTISTLPSASGSQTVEARIVAAPTATDANPTNNTAIATTLVRADADLSVTVEDSVDPVAAGNAFDYRVVVRNAGPQSVSNVVALLVRTGGVSSTITSTQGGCASASGGVRCDLDTLEAGASALIVMTVSAGASGTVSLRASVTSNGNDRVDANNSAQKSTLVQASTSANRSGGGAADWTLLATLLCLFVLRTRVRARALARAAMAVCAISCCAGYAVTANAGFNAWTMNGPSGGIIMSVATSASNDNVIYAVTFNALYRSSDAGTTWETVAYLDDQLLAFAVDPADSNRFYLSLNGRGLYRSDDGGRTRTLIATNNYPVTYCLAATTTTVYREMTDASFMVSADRGQTWVLRSHTPAVFGRLIVNDAKPNLIFGISSNDYSLYRSTDGGTSWTHVTVSRSQDATALIVAELVQVTTSSWVAKTQDGLYTSSDDGSSWTQTLTGYMGGGLAADPSTPGTVISSYGFPTFYLLRSTNSGATWAPFGSSPDFTPDKVIVHRSGRITALGGEGVFYSTNGGATWNESLQGPVASWVTRLVTTSGNNKRVYAVTSAPSGGLAYTSRDTVWQRVSLATARAALGINWGPASLAIKPNSNDNMLAANDAGTLYSSDSGLSWRRGTKPSGLNPKMVMYAGNPLAALAYAPSDSTQSAQPGGLFRSVDDGATWLPHSIDLPTDFLGAPRFVVDPSNPLRMYSLGVTLAQALEADGLILYRSMDGGVHWTPGLASMRARDITVHPIDGSVYVTAADGLHISRDGGVTSTSSNPFGAIANHAATAIAIDPQVPSTLYLSSVGTAPIQSAAEHSSYVLRSVDDGRTWETLRVASGSPSLQISELVLDPNNPSILYAPTFGLGVASFEVAPDMAVTISGHSGARLVGQDSNFDLRVQNFGPYAANDVRLAATLPTGAVITSVTADRGTCSHTTTSIVCTLGLLHVDDDVHAQVTYSVTAGAALVVTATVTAHERDSEPSNNIAQALAYSGQVADLGVATTASVATANIGDAITYLVQARNMGPSIASNSTLTFTPSTNQFLGPAPPGCSQSGASFVCNTGALAVASVVNYTFRTSVQSSGAAAAGVSIVPDASTIDPDAANNTALATVDVRPRGDLSVSIVDSADPALVGVDFEYRVVVANAGPDALPNVAVALVNSAKTVRVTSTGGSCTLSDCTLGNLPANATITITVVANSSTLGITSLRASVNSDGDDRAMFNNTAREFTSINAPPAGASASSSSGGGGNLQAWFVSLLALLLFAGGSRRRLRLPPPRMR